MGAFRFTSVVNGKAAWLMAPCLAMLAYGYIFYCGFLNFYLATACAVWILAALWRFSARRAWVAGVIGALGVLAHPLPIVWALCGIGYLYAARALAVRGRTVLLAGSAGGLVAARFVLAKAFDCQWSLHQIGGPGLMGIPGVDQFVPYGAKYLFLCAGLLLLWSRLFLERIDSAPPTSDPLGQLWLLNLFALFVLPSSILFPWYAEELQFIPERVGFFLMILFCAWLGAAEYRRGIAGLFGALAVIYFLFLFVDGRAINQVDAEIGSLVPGLPPEQRVVSSVNDTSEVRLNGLEHVLGWACIGRCFDYANTEPASRQFRVQVEGPGRVVAATLDTAFAIERGDYVVRKADAPLYSVCPSSVPGRRFELRKLEAGEKVCHVTLAVTPRGLGGLFW